MSATMYTISPPSNEVVAVSKVDKHGVVLSVVCNYRNKTLPVLGQLETLTRCCVGDEVLVKHTLNGAVIIGKLLADAQPPAAKLYDKQGHVTLSAEQSITLDTQRGSIEVCADGTIVLDGSAISATSEQDLTLVGWPIRLN